MFFLCVSKYDGEKCSNNIEEKVNSSGTCVYVYFTRKFLFCVYVREIEYLYVMLYILLTCVVSLVLLVKGSKRGKGK